MTTVKRKLRSKDGMSLLIALVGFMVAAMVSIVIVSAAVTAAQRVASDKKETQAHLLLESAAQVVAAELESIEYSFGDYLNVTEDRSTDRIDTGTGAVDTDKAMGARFASIMKQAVEAVQNGTDFNSTTALPAADFTVALASGSSDEEAQTPVNVSFVMKSGESKYDMIFTLRTEDPEQEIYINANGYCTSEREEDGKYHITWEVVSINRLSKSATGS